MLLFLLKSLFFAEVEGTVTLFLLFFLTEHRKVAEELIFVIDHRHVYMLTDQLILLRNISIFSFEYFG